MEPLDSLDSPSWLGQLLLARDHPAREAHALLKIEITRNLERLANYWASQRPRQSEDELHAVHKLVHARELAMHPLPLFERQAYERQRARLGRYMNGGRRRQLDELYEGLKRLEEIQAELVRVHAAEEDNPQLRYAEFVRRGPRLWFEAYQLILRLLAGERAGERPGGI